MQATAAAPPRTNRWSVVIAVGLVVFMATLDASVVTIALPVMQADLDVGAELAQWVILAYLLPLIAITMPAGRWVDRVGQRAALVSAVVGFGLASMLVGSARVFALLLLARAVQGVFAGVLFAMLTPVVTAAVRPEARGRAMGLATTLGPLGSVSGPVVGGLVTDWWGWPWIFWLNVPLAALIVAVLAVRMPASGPLRPPAPGTGREIALIGTATAALLLALTLSGRQHPAWLLLVLVALPPLAVWLRGREGRAVVLAHRDRRLRATQVALIASSVATGALTFLLPYFLQDDLSLSPGQAGLVVLAFPAATAIAGPAAGALADRLGPLPVGLVGAIVLSVGLLTVLPLDAGWQPVDLVWRLALAGAGMGIFYGPNLTLAMAAAPEQSMGVVGAAISLVRQVGFALGPALASLAWAAGHFAPAGMRAGLGLAALAAVGIVLALVSASGRSTTTPTH